MRLQTSMKLGEKFFETQTNGKATFWFLTEMLAPSSKKPEEREFVVDSRASLHML